MIVRIFVLIIAIGLALVLKGCGAVVPSTVSKLDRLSPVTADPAGLELALDVPVGLDLRAGSEILTLSAVDGGTGATASGRFVLQRREGADKAPRPTGRMVF